MTPLYHTAFRAMGCAITVQLQTKADGAAVLGQMPERFEMLENCLSRFRPQSELMRLNACAGSWVSVSETLFANLAAAKQAARLTDGLFNPLVQPALIASGYDRSFEQIALPEIHAAPAVPDWREIVLDTRRQCIHLPAQAALDLGGIAKGWAAQMLADELGVYGAALIDIGGDIAARGAPDGYPGWQVDIPMPGSDEVLASVMLRDTCIVTSGTDYRHWQTRDGNTYHHIIDPRTGSPARTDVLSVTIIHPNGAMAEAYAKAVLLLGSSAGLEWLNGQWDAAGQVVRDDGAVLATERFLAFMIKEITQ
jgi:thiamine biosynthesis lipoprotein